MWTSNFALSRWWRLSSVFWPFVQNLDKQAYALSRLWGLKTPILHWEEPWCTFNSIQTCARRQTNEKNNDTDGTFRCRLYIALVYFTNDWKVLHVVFGNHELRSRPNGHFGSPPLSTPDSHSLDQKLNNIRNPHKILPEDDHTRLKVSRSSYRQLSNKMAKLAFLGPVSGSHALWFAFARLSCRFL